MALTLAFDVYGTLIDTNGAINSIRKYTTDADAFAALLRQKQLEYTFRRGLMGQYCGFDQVTAEALDYCSVAFDLNLSDKHKQQLLDAYAHLPAYPDVRAALTALTGLPVKLLAFSNGETATVQELLSHAGIIDFFEALISVEAVGSFKPDPRVYNYLQQQCPGKTPWLVSANSFDIVGARAVGLPGIWLQRNEQQLFDSWGQPADKVIHNLQQLPVLLQKALR